MDISRRDALGLGLAGSIGLAGCATTSTVTPVAPETFGIPLAPEGVSPAMLARDETYWSGVAALFDVTDEIIQLENANWGMMARPVQAVYAEKLDMVNRRNSYYQRREYAGDLKAIAEQTATMLGVSPEEIAFTRGATEALQALISGYNNLGPGDAVMYADVDYDSMISAINWLKDRRGVEVISFDIPEPATRENVLASYEAALKANPHVKLVLTTHVSHRNGLVIPIADIADLARGHGADIIVDAAHSFGQIDFLVPDLKADFVGLNMHKWIGAPIGVGVMYIRKERIGDIDPFMGEYDTSPPDIRARVHSGTVNFAAFLAMPEAIRVHSAIGVANKAARLQYLRDLWAEPLRDHPGIEILTPEDPTMHAGITSFRLKGQTSPAENIALARQLLDQYGIFTVHRTGLAQGACVRAAPSYFTMPSDVDALRRAILEIASTG